MLLKQIISSVLLLALIGQSLNRALIVSSYFTNTASYAKNCENKARPSLHCNGKCQMLKKLKQEDKKDQQSPERKGDSKEIACLSSRSFFPSLHHFIAYETTTYVLLNSGTPTGMPRTVFHPPGC